MLQYIIKLTSFENGLLRASTEWPTYSPDLNLIEPTWAALKDALHQAHPELRQSSRQMGGTSCTTRYPKLLQIKIMKAIAPLVVAQLQFVV